MDWTRYAMYWLPDGPLGRAGADWMGWDARSGATVPVAAPDTDGVRKYGFHATIKPPFRLAPGTTGAEVLAAARKVCAGLAPVDLGLLHVRSLGRFMALTPDRDPGDMAAAVVAGLDAFRAPSTDADLSRRRAAGLSAAQEALLLRWGYPYVMEEFRMHLTLSGPDPSAGTEARARAVFAPLAGPHRIDTLSLVGEDGEGWFRLIADIPLGGRAGRAEEDAP